MSSSEVVDASRALAGIAARLDAGGDAIDDAALQDLMGVAVRLYAERVERAGDMAVVKPSTINATDALVTTTALLRAVNVQVFELGLWQAWAH
jgi:hypothetical protein